jgi:hypothetical protein
MFGTFLSAWVAVKVSLIFPKFLMSIGLGDVRDVPVCVGGCDVTCSGVHGGPGPPHHRFWHPHLCARLCRASGYVL